MLWSHYWTVSIPTMCLNNIIWNVQGKKSTKINIKKNIFNFDPSFISLWNENLIPPTQKRYLAWMNSNWNQKKCSWVTRMNITLNGCDTLLQTHSWQWFAAELYKRCWPTGTLCFFQIQVFIHLNSASDITWQQIKIYKGNRLKMSFFFFLLDTAGWWEKVWLECEENSTVWNPGCCAALQGKRWPCLTFFFFNAFNTKWCVYCWRKRENALKKQNRSQLWSLGRPGSTEMLGEPPVASLRGRRVTQTPPLKK